MDYKYIEQLVDRYFEGETTLEEEQILRSFFRQEHVPSTLQAYQDLFRYELAATEEKLSDEFDARILAAIEQPVVKSRRVGFSTVLQPFYRAAAIVAILLTVGNAAQHSFTTETDEAPESGSYVSTFTEPAASMQQVTSAANIVPEGNKTDSLTHKEIEKE